MALQQHHPMAPARDLQTLDMTALQRNSSYEATPPIASNIIQYHPIDIAIYTGREILELESMPTFYLFFKLQNMHYRICTGHVGMNSNNVPLRGHLRRTFSFLRLAIGSWLAGKGKDRELCGDQSADLSLDALVDLTHWLDRVSIRLPVRSMVQLLIP